jgi:hypothetical protein
LYFVYKFVGNNVCDGFPDTFEWGVWAQPDLKELQRLMRYVYEHPAEARQKGLAARMDAKRWTWDNAAQIAIQHLQLAAKR